MFYCLILQFILDAAWCAAGVPTQVPYIFLMATHLAALTASGGPCASARQNRRGPSYEHRQFLRVWRRRIVAGTGRRGKRRTARSRTYQTTLWRYCSPSYCKSCLATMICMFCMCTPCCLAAAHMAEKNPCKLVGSRQIAWMLSSQNTTRCHLLI